MYEFTLVIHIWNLGGKKRLGKGGLVGPHCIQLISDSLRQFAPITDHSELGNLKAVLGVLVVNSLDVSR